ncbi:CST complex subunit TEN1-like [Babylonia areolata]|uniref:CST complex subunit TEN1-like n=1 Tax=Babylonia areolata TaxID=304850 RepID=UPI003FD22D02
MEARNIPPSGKQVTVKDMVVLTDWLHKSVNVTGRLEEHNVVTCRAKLGAPRLSHRVTIDTRLVEPFDARLGSMFQFIGEVKEEEEDQRGNRWDEAAGGGGGGGLHKTRAVAAVVVEARVVRNCDGLDLVAYEQALRKQREYLASRRAAGGGGGGSGGDGGGGGGGG